MTPTQAQEIVTAACILANPDILKLEFGCKVIMDERKGIYISHIPLVRHSKEEEPFGVQILLEDIKQSVQNFPIEKFNEWFEILGRDLTLADVLLAIEQKYMFDANQFGQWNAIDELVKDKYHTGELIHEKYWNLRLPFHLQEDETKIFLANLLGK